MKIIYILYISIVFSDRLNCGLMTPDSSCNTHSRAALFCHIFGLAFTKHVNTLRVCVFVSMDFSDTSVKVNEFPYKPLFSSDVMTPLQV